MVTTGDGALVEAARAGDSQAFGKLFDAWFDRVHDLSRRIVKDPGIAAEVAQDCFLSAWTRLPTLEDPDAFGGWLLRIARNASLNRLAKERRTVALDDETMTSMTDHDATTVDPLAAMDQAARVDMVWDAAAALGPRDASVLDLHLRHGLGPSELAEELGTTPNNAHQILFTLRKRLATNVRALVLWRAGRPSCTDLRRTLVSAGATGFDKATVKLIDRHAEACASCNDERTERLSPAALFGAAPVVAAPFLLKAQAASALEAAGVPMSGSAALGADPVSLGHGHGHGDGPSPDNGTVSTPSGGGGSIPGDRSEISPAQRTTALGHRRVRGRVVAVAALVVAFGAIALVVDGASGGGDDTELATVASTTTTTTGPIPTSTGPIPSTTQGGSFEVDTRGSATVPAQPPAVLDPTPPDPPSGTTSPTSPTVPPIGTRPPSTDPGTGTTSPEPTTTAPPTAPPQIREASATITYATCQQGYLWNLAWLTEEADSVRISAPGLSVDALPPDGTTTACVPTVLGTPTPFTFSAHGGGGTTTRTVQGQSAPPIL